MADKESESVNGFGKIGGESGRQVGGGTKLCWVYAAVLSERLPHYSPFLFFLPPKSEPSLVILQKMEAIIVNIVFVV